MRETSLDDASGQKKKSRLAWKVSGDSMFELRSLDHRYIPLCPATLSLARVLLLYSTLPLLSIPYPPHSLFFFADIRAPT